VNPSKEFVKLDKSIHDRTSFDCGEIELNEFIQKHASKQMAAGINTTMVLPASELLPDDKYPVCAFYTIAPSSIRVETLPESYRKKLPHYPVPVFLIAQMAVHSECQGQGLGKITLIKALEYLWIISSNYMKAYAVIIDCLNESAETFYAHFDFKTLDQNEGRKRMFLPMKTIGQLF